MLSVASSSSSCATIRSWLFVLEMLSSLDLEHLAHGPIVGQVADSRNVSQPPAGIGACFRRMIATDGQWWGQGTKRRCRRHGVPAFSTVSCRLVVGVETTRLNTQLCVQSESLLLMVILLLLLLLLLLMMVKASRVDACGTGRRQMGWELASAQSSRAVLLMVVLVVVSQGWVIVVCNDAQRFHSVDCNLGVRLLFERRHCAIRAFVLAKPNDDAENTTMRYQIH